MIDLSRIYHTGMAVADIDAACASVGAALGLRWAPIREFDPLPFWTPEEGSHEVRVRATYSVGSPVAMEIVQGTGGFYDPRRAPDARHIGLWVDDLRAEADALVAQGWTVRAANAAPQDGYGMIAYLEAPMGGMLIELVSMDLKPAIDEWMAG